jgi:CHRD domain-containing protein
MHRGVFVVLAACAAIVACDDNGSTSPSSQPLVFTTILRPANEVPPIMGAESGGVGAAQITLHVTRSGDTITGATADMYFQASAFPATTVIGAHIHPGVAGINGPVIVSTGLTATNSFPVASGTGEFSARDVPVDAATTQGLINNPQAYYFNIHSPSNPGGFARGQLARIQ